MPRISERQGFLTSVDRILRYIVAFDEERSRDFEEILEISIL